MEWLCLYLNGPVLSDSLLRAHAFESAEALPCAVGGHLVGYVALTLEAILCQEAWFSLCMVLKNGSVPKRVN